MSAFLLFIEHANHGSNRYTQLELKEAKSRPSSSFRWTKYCLFKGRSITYGYVELLGESEMLVPALPYSQQLYPKKMKLDFPASSFRFR